MKKVKTVAKSNTALVTISRAKFTASDLKNDLYAIAKQATNKTADPKQINAAISGYRAILSVVKTEITAAKLGMSFNGNN